METSRGWGEKGVSEEGQQRRMGAAPEEKRSQVTTEKPKEEGASEDRKGAAGPSAATRQGPGSTCTQERGQGWGPKMTDFMGYWGRGFRDKGEKQETAQRGNSWRTFATKDKREAVGKGAGWRTRRGSGFLLLV